MNVKSSQEYLCKLVCVCVREEGRQGEWLLVKKMVRVSECTCRREWDSEPPKLRSCGKVLEPRESFLKDSVSVNCFSVERYIACCVCSGPQWRVRQRRELNRSSGASVCTQRFHMDVCSEELCEWWIMCILLWSALFCCRCEFSGTGVLRGKYRGQTLSFSASAWSCLLHEFCDKRKQLFYYLWASSSLHVCTAEIFSL